MKIRTRVKIAGALAICVLLAYGAWSIYRDRIMDGLTREVKEAHHIANKVFALRALTYDFLSFPTERAQRQWSALYEELLGLLGDPAYRELEHKYGIADFADKLKIVSDTFARLSAIKETQLDSPEAEIRRELQSRLTTQLLLTAQDIVTRTSRMTEEINEKLIAAQRVESYFDLLALFLLGFLIISTGVLLQRSVVKPVLRLHEGVEKVGAGNLDYKVGMTSPDEIGELSRAFDRMTANLHQITVSRDDLIKEIDERKWVEARVARQNAIMEGIGRIFKEALTSETEEQVGETCLAVAKELTGSKFGFIDELNPEGKLDCIAISYLGWEACKISGSEKLVLPKNLHLRGIFAPCLQRGKSEIVNDPAIHPDRVGTPESHPPITSFLGAPLRRGDEIIGMIGLGNKQGGYTEADREAVEALAPAVVEALMRKRAEEKIKHLASFPQMNPAPVLETDLSGRVTYHNSAAMAVLERLGPEAQMSDLLPGDLEDIIAATREKKEKFFFREVSIKDRIFGQNIFFAEPFNLLRIYNLDITERKRAEEKLQDTLVELESSNKELEAFSYSIAHDLKAPLRAIHGFARILLEEHAASLDEEGKRLLDVVSQNALRMSELIEDLLSLSRVGLQKLELRPLNLASMVKWQVEELQVKDRSRDLQLILKDLPLAYGDPVLLEQVMANLLDNAVKYTKDRERSVIEVGGWIENNQNIYYVKDNGVGFDMSYADKLFGVFQRLHTEREFTGTGVGLAIVRRIVTRHGGRVWAEGKVDEGATFYFSLPRQDEDKSY
jgi:signal transduction histidine kinase/HAMP domain-containing protein